MWAFGMILLFVLAAVVVAVGQRGMVMGMGVPRGSMLVVVADPTGMVVADMPMVVAMLGCRMGVLGLLAFSSVRCLTSVIVTPPSDRWLL